MKELPILFSGPMVRAILEGRKTQTRRIVKPQPIDNKQVDGNFYAGDYSACVKMDGHPNWRRQFAFEAARWQPGDRLWVRESWCIRHTLTHAAYYRATEPNASEKWKPSIHMPRWASRITMEVVSVRVERLQDISEADAKAEGAEPVVLLPDDDTGLLTTVMHDTGGSCRDGFAALWASINGLNSWQANPWVWVVEFKVIRP